MQTGDSAAREVGSSFRDPGGRLFLLGPSLYRHVMEPSRADYDQLMRSGLYEALAGRGLLVPHREVPDPTGAGLLTLEPERVPFVSYPYEWGFSQLKAAALATLAIQKEALARGMVLKDASAYNIQFSGHRAYLIDTLSFERYREGSPWIAYRQFCQHFLAPLALAAHRDQRLNRLLHFYLDGIPLDLASGLLPFSTRLTVSLGVHVHMHARSQKKHADSSPGPGRAMRPLAMWALVDSLEQAVGSLRWRPPRTEWGHYYESSAHYGEEAQAAKARLLEELIRAVPGPLRQVWDLGANTGRYSQLAASAGAYVVAFDADEVAVERHLRRVEEEKDGSVLPLWVDLENPSPSLGWSHQERDSLEQRGPADLVLALALLHHLAIGNNTPLELVARCFARLGRWLAVEWVPKEDPQVQKLLRSRVDVFADYTLEGFRSAFGRHFEVVREAPIDGSARRLYLMQRHV